MSETGDNKEYKIEALYDNVVYAKEADEHLLKLYYLVAWKYYPEEENIWELSSAVMHLRKMVNTFFKNNSEKLIVTSALLDSIPTITKLIIKSPAKWKQEH